MATRDEIIGFCDRLLDIEEFEDYGPNGLQVPGAAEVSKLVSGVSANLEFLRRAVDSGAQLAIVHHGLFWNSMPRALSEQMAARLRTALCADVSVAAYHLPLDAHPEVGNNALLRDLLGFEADPRPFGDFKGSAIGTIGRNSEGVEAADLFARVADAVGRDPLVIDGGPDRVHSLALVTGAGADEIHAAVALGVDAFLTGEPAEHATADAREGGVHFIAAGHHATETFGIRRVGELVAERFGVEHEFVDVPNPI